MSSTSNATCETTWSSASISTTSMNSLSNFWPGQSGTVTSDEPRGGDPRGSQWGRRYVRTANLGNGVQVRDFGISAASNARIYYAATIVARKVVGQFAAMASQSRVREDALNARRLGSRRSPAVAPMGELFERGERGVEVCLVEHFELASSRCRRPSEGQDLPAIRHRSHPARCSIGLDGDDDSHSRRADAQPRSKVSATAAESCPLTYAVSVASLVLRDRRWSMLLQLE